MPLNHRLAMKWTAFVLLSIILHASASALAQTLLTLTEKSAPLEKAFADIQKQSGYSIWYDNAALKGVKPVDLRVVGATLEQVMDLCCRDQPISYTIVGKMVVIKAKDGYQNALPWVMDIKGKVTDEKGQPLSGATITVLRKNRSVISKENGEFEIKGLEENSTIVVSHIGYESLEIKPGNKPFVLVQLRLSVSKLDDVQVIAYGTTTKRLNTGDVSTVNSEIIESQPVSSPLEALEARVPGLDITQQTGLPGGAFTVRIRGQNSIANGNDPLYIVDGVPFSSSTLIISGGIINGGSPLDYLDPADIENIEVLKDADATAIYGSRAANGAILITTKKGKSGKTNITLNIYNGVGAITRKMNLLSTPQYLQMRHEAFVNDGASPNPNSDYDLTAWDTLRNTDWQKALIGGTANILDAQAAISGGNANNQFFFGAGYHGATTVFPGDFNDQKESVHFNVTNTSENKKFNVTFSGTYVVDNNKLIQSDLTPEALTLPPDAPSEYDSTGKLNWANGTYNNPYSALLQGYNENTSNLIGNAVINYNILPVLKFRANLGYTKIGTTEVTPTPAISFNPSYGVTTGSSSFANNTTTSWIIEPQIEYQSKIGKGQLNILIGSTILETANQSQFIYASGYTSDALLMSITAAANLTSLSDGYTQYRYSAGFARITYDWQKKYLFNLTGRRDGSSRFGPDKRIANFGAMGAGWIFSSEKFIRDNFTAFSFGKLRLSYGITGNDQIGDYQYLSNWSSTAYPYQGNPSLYPSNLFNPNYSWETNKKFEIGLDIGFLHDRVLFSGSYYNNRSSNQLIGYPLPLITGFSSVQSNLPALVENYGEEFEFNTININTSGLSWSTSFNITFPNNKLVSYPNFSASNYVNRFVIGQPLSIVKAFHFIGVNPQTGLFEFENVSGGNQITYPDDLTAYKKVAKAYYGGLLNSISYNRWKLDVFFQFTKQTGYNYFYGNSNAPGMMGNQPTIVMNRWQKPGDIKQFEKFTQSFGSASYSAFSDFSLSDFGVSDASFIRLKNLVLSYQFGENFNRKSHLQNLTVYVKAQNLITITKYLGQDPENNGSLSLPPLKIITAGIKIIF